MLLDHHLEQKRARMAEHGLNGVVEVLSGPDESIAPGASVDFVSDSVQDSLHWQVRKERDGVSKIMIHQFNPAFETGSDDATALLLLAHFDEELNAYRAAMGKGLLSAEHLPAVQAHLAGQA